MELGAGGNVHGVLFGAGVAIRMEALVMVTKQQALTENEFHLGECKVHRGNRGSRRLIAKIYRRNGRTKIWVTRPDEFRVPVKFGLYGFAYVCSNDGDLWHVRGECPAVREMEAEGVH